MRVAMASVVGGTASSLGGGKFANGAVSAAFVAMYNEMGHESRQEIVNRRAKEILDTDGISSKIKHKLRYLLSKGKVLYTDSTSKPAHGWKDGVYRGWSRRGMIAVTSALWDKNGYLDSYQLTETLLHEMTHQIWAGTSADHPFGFREFYRKQTMIYYSNGDRALELF